MVRRLSEFKQKLHPNAKLRAWYSSHTFGGTTKAKTLKILGFSKINFYYVAAGVGAILIIAAVGAGIGVKTSVQAAKVQGAKDGIVGQPMVQSTTQERIRTLVSDGQTIITTETSAYLTTYQRGGGLMVIKTKDENGEQITVPISLSIITNSEGDIETKTFFGSPVLIPHTVDGVSQQTLVYGEQSVFTNDAGEVATSTVFSDVAVTTDENGETITSVDTSNPEPGATATSDDTIDPTNTASASGGSPPGEATTTDKTSPAATSAAPTSAAVTTSMPAVTSQSASAKASPSSAASSSASGGGSDGGGGGGGEEFSGEATFYAPGLGSCGTEATDDDFVAALSKVLFDATGVTNSNANPYCGRKAFVKAASKERRRWQNMTGGIESWEKSRSERFSRRSLLSAGKDGFDGRTPSKNESGNGPGEGYSNSPPMPGITPPPEMEMELWERQAGGGGVTITIVDRCPVCKQYDLDLSPAAYNILGDADAGRIDIKWKWLD